MGVKVMGGVVSRCATAVMAIVIGASVSLVSGYAAAAADFGGEAGLSTEYIGKGVGKSQGEPSASGTARLSGKLVYASAFATTAKFKQGGDAELILTAGAQPRFGKVGLDLAVLDRRVLNDRRGFDSDYVELQADAVRSFGKSKVRLRVNYSPDGYGPAKHAWWSEAQVGLKVSRADTASVTYGVRRTQGGVDYDAWSVGVKHAFTPRVAADLRYYDTDRHVLGSEYDAKAVACLTLTF